MEIKYILRQYSFSLVVILCSAALFCGMITVREKTDYNMKMTSHDIVRAEKNEEGVRLFLGENKNIFMPDYAGNFVKELKKALNKGVNYIF